jgi:nucleotide-binding universal stress UspA family protein
VTDITGKGAESHRKSALQRSHSLAGDIPMNKTELDNSQVYKRVELNNVLFLTDFSWASDWALPFVREIAQEYGAKVTALHVAVPDALAYMTPDSTAAAIALQHDSALSEMKRVEAKLDGIAHQTKVIAAKSVWSAVEVLLRQEHVDLVVVGTHGRTGLPKLLLGSTAEEIFRCSPVAVITVGPAARVDVQKGAHWQRVLFATDFSPESLAAAAHAISFAEENYAQLTLVHVIEMAGARKEAKQAGLSVAEAMHRLHELVPAEAELWCRPETGVEHGEPAGRILALAEEKKADLIVLGVRNRNHVMVTSHLVNSIPHTIVVHASCPVLTVRS